MIDEAEIARLRALYSPGGERGDLTMLRVLDEVERLRGDIAARSWAQNDRHNDELRYFAVGEKLAKERAEKAERERDEARAACAAKDEGLRALYNWTFRPCDSERLYGTRESAHAAYGVAIAADAGRPILDALKQAEEALEHALGNDPRNGVLARALAALEGLRR